MEGGGDQGRAEITVSYLHHNMNDSAEKKKNNYLHFGNNYNIYTIEITLARYFSNTFFHNKLIKYYCDRSRDKRQRRGRSR